MVETWKIFEYWLPKFAALLSLLGSSMIVAEVYQDWKIRRYSRQGLSAVSRALLSMSIGDIFFSFAWFMASWVVSQNEMLSTSFEASQTSSGCKFQGFLVQFGFAASICFNASLAVIYLLMVRYHWTNQKITQRFNYVAAIIWLFALVFAIMPLVYNLYHDIGENCWLSAPPSDLPQCQTEESFYEHPECIERNDITNLLMATQILPVWICIILNARIMWVIYRETRKMESVQSTATVMISASTINVGGGRGAAPVSGISGPESEQPPNDDDDDDDMNGQANPQEEEDDDGDNHSIDPGEDKPMKPSRPSWRRQPDENVEPAMMLLDDLGRPIEQAASTKSITAAPEPAAKTPTGHRPSWRRDPGEDVDAEPASLLLDDLGRPIEQPPQTPAKAAAAAAAAPPTPAPAKTTTTEKKKKEKGGGLFGFVTITKKEPEVPTAKSFFGWRSSAQESTAEHDIVPPKDTQQNSSSAPIEITPGRPPATTQQHQQQHHQQQQQQQKQQQVEFETTNPVQVEDEGSKSYTDEEEAAPIESGRSGMDRSTMSQSAVSQSGRRSRTVGIQGLWYISGFFVTYMPGTISVLVFAVSGEWSTPLYRASLTFLALQGAWNFVVFAKGRRDMKTWLGRKVKKFIFDKLCCCNCIPKVMVPPSPGPSMLTPKTSRVSKRSKEMSGAELSVQSSGSGLLPNRGSGFSARSGNNNNMLRSDVSTEIHANKRSVNFTSIFSNASTVVHANTGGPLTSTASQLVSVAEDASHNSNALQDDPLVISNLPHEDEKLPDTDETGTGFHRTRRPLLGADSDDSVCGLHDDDRHFSSDDDDDEEEEEGVAIDLQELPDGTVLGEPKPRVWEDSDASVCGGGSSSSDDEDEDEETPTNNGYSEEHPRTEENDIV